MPNLSWRRGQALSDVLDPDVFTQFDRAQDDRQAQIAQAIHLIRRNDDSDVTINPNWWPYWGYSDLVLSVYLGGTMQSPVLICPEDRALLSLRDRSQKDARLAEIASETGESISNSRRLAYRSTYWQTAAASQNNIGRYTLIPLTQRTHGNPVLPSGRFGAKRFVDVAFPSQKVDRFDQQDRHSSRRQKFYAEADASQPLSFFDASVTIRTTRDANVGANPRVPQGLFGGNLPLEVTYRPVLSLGDVPAAQADVEFAARYWYTAGGLRGVDFGGKEIRTSTLSE
jgi:hypothetical protein